MGLTPEESPDEAMRGIIADNKAANAETTGALALDLLQIDSGQIAARFTSPGMGPCTAMPRRSRFGIGGFSVKRLERSETILEFSRDLR